MNHDSFCFSTRFLLSHSSLRKSCFPYGPRSCWFFNGFLLSLLEHAAVPLWFMILSVSPQGSFCLSVHYMNPVYVPTAPVPVGSLMGSCSLLDHAAVLLWFAVLSVSPQGSFCLIVHYLNPAFPMAPRPCWFFNGFLLSFRTCRCSPMVHVPFCFSTRFLLSHGSLYEPCFRLWGPTFLLVVLTIYAPMIYTAPCVSFLMWADR